MGLSFSTAPGWRPLRWFALAAISAAVFTAGDAAIASDMPDELCIWIARVQTVAAGVHGACWFFYDAARRGRALTRVERAVVAIGLAAGALAFIPGLIHTPRVAPRTVEWLGVRYRDVIPTSLGAATLTFYSVALGVLGARMLRDAPPGARSEGVALVLLALTALHDTVAFTLVLPVPYLLSVGFLGVIAGVGSGVSARFVQNARALDEALGALRETREALVKRERLAALGEMSAVVAHEVRNPLAVMFNALASVRRGALDPQQSMLLGIVDEEARRLQRLVDDLLDFCRPVTLRCAPTELGPLLDEAVAAARAALAGTERPAVETGVAPAAARFTLDAERVRRAVVNLVDNALRAPGCTRVTVHAAREGEDLVVEVRDDGEGVPNELQDKVFAPFYSARPAGTGLGLAIVRNVAAAHGGEVTYRDAPERGAVFTLRVPPAGGPEG